MKHAGSGSRTPRELELKLQLPPGSRAMLEASSSFAGADTTQRHLVTTYFDTSEGLLNTAGLTLRVRRCGDALIQTVKSRADGQGVVSDRSEWEWPVRQDQPDPGCLAGVKELAGIVDAIDGRLQPLFVTDIRRSTRLLHLDGGTVVEAALDEGCIVAGIGREPVSELELELKGGGVGPLYQLAADLHAVAPFWISPESKCARGLRLRCGGLDTRETATRATELGAQKGRAPKLGSNISAAEGLHDIVGASLGHLTANIGPTLRGNAEGLHQMRLALREARAALQLFMPQLDGAADRFSAELRAFDQVLGTARDWDVFVLETLPVASTELPPDQLRTLQEVGARERAAANAAVKEAIQGHDFTELVLRLAGWLEDASAHPRRAGTPRMRHSLCSLVPELLDRAAAQTKKRARHAGRLSAEDRHRLRKSLKRLSYAVGHLAGAYGHRPVKTYRTRCAALQRMLGIANDAAVTRRLAMGLATEQDPALTNAAGALAVWSDHQGRRALKDVGRTAARLFGTRQFWAQGA